MRDWEFNILNIYNFQKPGKFDLYFNYVRENIDERSGDLCEFGVFRGSTILATALLLKELGSDKKVYGYDSFSGFPSFNGRFDRIEAFESMHEANLISDDHLKHVERNMKLLEFRNRARTTLANVSSSGDFSNVAKDELERKIDFLGLDNIELVEGPFSETLADPCEFEIFGAFFDCDLYQSYVDAFRFVWPNLKVGGFCFLDEYFSLKFPGARLACHHYLADKEYSLVRAPLDPYCDFERWGLVKNG